jgi:hypothetical protein
MFPRAAAMKAGWSAHRTSHRSRSRVVTTSGARLSTVTIGPGWRNGTGTFNPRLLPPARGELQRPRVRRQRLAADAQRSERHHLRAARRDVSAARPPWRLPRLPKRRTCSTAEDPRPRPPADHRGEKDHAVPWAIANAAYRRQRRKPAVTEILKIPNRGHPLTIDHGWREVARRRSTSSSGSPKRSRRGDDAPIEREPGHSHHPGLLGTTLS